MAPEFHIAMEAAAFRRPYPAAYKLPYLHSHNNEMEVWIVLFHEHSYCAFTADHVHVILVTCD